MKVFRYDLYTADRAVAGLRCNDHAHAARQRRPTMTAEFLAYDDGYTGGVSLSTGWVAGAEGGAKSIVTGQLAGDGTVRVWSSGSRLDGEPGMYIESPDHHSGNVVFAQIASFAPFPATRRSRGDGGDDQHHDRGGSPGQRRGRQRHPGQQVRLGAGRPAATTLSPTLLATLPVRARTASARPALAGR